MNIYLLGVSIVFSNGIPVITVATNSGVTFEEKLNKIGIELAFVLINEILMLCRRACCID